MKPCRFVLPFLCLSVLSLTSCSSQSTGNGGTTEDNSQAQDQTRHNHPQRDLSIIQVPRPNSGRYTTEEATKLLPSILARSEGIDHDSELITNWKNPTHGFRVYVLPNGTIETRDFFGKTSKGMDGLLAALELGHSMQYGNPLNVLVASTHGGWKTETESRIIELLFQPSIQLYIVGTAEGVSQPACTES